MFHFKDILNRVAHGPSPSSPARSNEPDTTEGFLCPQCMNAFPSQEELQIHYSASHKDNEPPVGTPNSNNEDISVFQSFHQGVGDKYKQVSVSSGEEAVEEVDSILADIQGELSSELTIKELMKKLKELIKQNGLIAEEKKQVEQRAAALAEKVVALKATADEGESEMAALTKRLALVESQLAHRENIDDAAVLRQELIQVQRVMDEMTREREMESDQLKRDLQNLQEKYDNLESESVKIKSLKENMNRVEILEKELEEKEEALQKVTDEKMVLMGTLGMLEGDFLENSTKLNETEDGLKNLRLALSESQLSAENYKEKVIDLEKQLYEASVALEESSKEPAQLRDTIKRLETDNANDKKVILDLQSEISKHLSVISEKNQELMTVTGKVEVLTSQLKDYAISNEDLRSHNAEQARYLEDKMKLVASMEDKEKEIKKTLDENAAQMGLLNKNYLELMNLVQAQMHNNSKMEPDIEKKLLGQIESAVDILTKKSSEFDNSSNDKLQKEEEVMTEGKMIAQLQSQCNEKAEKLIEAERRITILSTEIESKAITEKAKAEEYEAIISSLKFNLQKNNDEVFAQSKILKELEEQLASEKSLVSQKDGKLRESNAKYWQKVKELAAINNVVGALKKDLHFCKNLVLQFIKEFNQESKVCREKLIVMSGLQQVFESNAKDLIKVKEELTRTQGIVNEKNSALNELVNKLDAELKKKSELQDLNSIKSMEVDELNSLLTLEKQKCCQLESTVEELRCSNSKTNENLEECEDKVRCLTADLLTCEKLKADLEIKFKELEEKLQAEISKKEMCIANLEREKNQLAEQNAEIRERLEELEIKYKTDMEKGSEEVDQLRNKLSKEEKLREEVTKNLEEEMLGKAALEKEFSQFKLKHEGDVKWLNNSIGELKREMEVTEEEKKAKDTTIDKLRENISTMQMEWETERQALLERYIQSTKENEQLHSTTNDLRRRLEDSQAALHEIGRENQTYQMEIAKLSGRKWTEDADATNCMKCSKEFSIRVRKHHCRNCGQIFCNDCSLKTAAIASNKKPVRVCDPCYFELVPN